MLANHEVAVLVLQIAPHAVEVDGVSHHGVVDQGDAKTLAIFQPQRFSVGEFDTVERPRELLHVAGKVQFDCPSRLSTIGIDEGAPQIGVRQHSTPVVA
ncbi:hypothetical protein D9M71_627940 [compost metagenome]